MTIDKDKLKALAEAATRGEWLVNGKQSIRGSAGEYIAKTNWSNGASNAEFIAAANPATILALLAEIERGNRLFAATCLALGSVGEALGIPGEEQEGGACELIEAIDQLKAENEALRKALGKISVQVDGNIRCTVRDVVNGLPDVQDIYGYCDNIDEIIAAAMAKEAALYAFKPLGDES